MGAKNPCLSTGALSLKKVDYLSGYVPLGINSSDIFWKITYKTGIKKIPKTAARNIPPKTGVPTSRRLMAPEPVAMTHGIKPRTKAKLVIKTARKRSLAPATADSVIVIPLCKRRSLANSTIKIAFLLAIAIKTIRPICA